MKGGRWFWWYFLVFGAVLLLRNRFLFTRVTFEEGDAAANSLLVDNAKHLTQLVGNYSRVGFHHPGPAFLYVHAAGEWLAYDLLGIVPSPWNGQMLAVLLLNAALLAATLAIVLRRLTPAAVPDRSAVPDPSAWRQRVWPAVALGGTVLVYVTYWQDLVASTWPPFEYFPPYLLILAAAASVASGGARDLWALALATGLLINGHAEFLFLATVLVGVAVAGLVWRHRREVRRRDVILASAVFAALLMPTAINTLLRWPGEFGRYFSYGGEREHNELGEAVHYVIALWDRDWTLAVVTLVGTFAAGLAAARVSREPFVVASVAITGVALGSFLFYAVVGIDAFDPYIGIFTRGMPLFLLVVTVGVTATHVRFARRPVAVLTGAGGLLLAMTSPTLVNSQPTLRDVPATLDTLRSLAGPDQPVVVTLGQRESWAEALPLALQARRDGLRVCLADQSFALEATDALICDPAEVLAGLPVTMARAGGPPDDLVLIATVEPSCLWVSRDLGAVDAAAPTPTQERRADAEQDQCADQPAEQAA